MRPRPYHHSGKLKDEKSLRPAYGSMESVWQETVLDLWCHTCSAKVMLLGKNYFRSLDLAALVGDVRVSAPPCNGVVRGVHLGYGKYRMEWWSGLALCEEHGYGTEFSLKGTPDIFYAALKDWFGGYTKLLPMMAQGTAKSTIERMDVVETLDYLRRTRTLLLDMGKERRIAALFIAINDAVKGESHD